MTIDEYKRALDKLSDEKLRKFNTDFGGGDLSREQRVTEFVQNPKHERRICQLLGLITQEERLAQASLKSAKASIISSLAAVLAIGLTIVNIFISNAAIKKQVALSVTPQIRILPSDDVKGKIGEFELTLSNPSPANFTNVRVYEDYFVSLTPKGGRITCHRFGSFSIKPDSFIGALNAGEAKPFGISFQSIHDDMKKLYISDAKGHRMMLVRLTIKFSREVDGMEFTRSKAYIICGHGDFLVDHDERGMDSPGGPTYSEIKKALGVSSD